MTDVDVTLRLPEPLVEKARALGLLTPARMTRLLAAELSRMESWAALDTALQPARESFRADHADLSEDEVLAMLSDFVHAVRDEDPDDAV